MLLLFKQLLKLLESSEKKFEKSFNSLVSVSVDSTAV